MPTFSTEHWRIVNDCIAIHKYIGVQTQRICQDFWTFTAPSKKKEHTYLTPIYGSNSCTFAPKNNMMKSIFSFDHQHVSSTLPNGYHSWRLIITHGKHFQEWHLCNGCLTTKPIQKYRSILPLWLICFHSEKVTNSQF